MFNHYRIALVIGVALTLSAAGCADDGGQAPAAATIETEDSAAAEDTAYIGSWHDTLTVEEASDLGDGRLAGDFELTLNSDGTYSMKQSLDPAFDGRYKAESGNRLVFSKDTGCDMKFGGVGVYSWKVTGDELVLKNVVPETGGCTGRTDTLTFPVWRRR